MYRLIKLLVLLFVNNVYARSIPDNHLRAVKPAALSEAYTAVADNADALYYNPAGLIKIQRVNGELIAPLVGFSSNSLKFASDPKSFETLFKGSLDKQENVEAMEESLDKFSQNPLFVRTGFHSYIVGPGWGFSTFLNQEASLKMQNPNPGVIDVLIPIDADLRLGYANSHWNDKFSWGIAVSYRARVAVETDMSIGDFLALKEKKSASKDAIKDFLKDKIGQGWGIGTDAGFLITPIEKMKPTLGVSILNIGDLSFKPYSKNSIQKKLSSNSPKTLPQSVNLGFSISPLDTTTRFRFSFDFRDVNIPYPSSYKWATGAEFGFNTRYLNFNILGGYSIRGFSGGIEINLLLLKIKYATYLMEQDYLQIKNAQRRHLISLNILI